MTCTYCGGFGQTMTQETDDLNVWSACRTCNGITKERDVPQPAAVQAIHNTTRGRIFIFGNGPSLVASSSLLGALNQEATFTCNNFGLWEGAPFEPTYYGISDIYEMRLIKRCLFPQWAHTQRFHVGWPGDHYPRHESFTWVEKAHDSIQVQRVGFAGLGDEMPPIPTGRTTPLTLAQLAAWMGYREFYFLGIEQSPVGYAHDPEKDTNMRGQPRPTHPRMIQAIQRSFIRAREDIEAAGGVIYDCTEGGFLNETGREQKRRGLSWKECLPYKELSDALSMTDA